MTNQFLKLDKYQIVGNREINLIESSAPRGPLLETKIKISARMKSNTF